MLHHNLIETDELEISVKSMVSRFPEFLEMKCVDGNFALHVALDCTHSEEVVLAIFNPYNEASQEKFLKCELPLHQAIRNIFSEVVVLAIFDAYSYHCIWQ